MKGQGRALSCRARLAPETCIPPRPPSLPPSPIQDRAGMSALPYSAPVRCVFGICGSSEHDTQHAQRSWLGVNMKQRPPPPPPPRCLETAYLLSWSRDECTEEKFDEVLTSAQAFFFLLMWATNSCSLALLGKGEHACLPNISVAVRTIVCFVSCFTDKATTKKS